MFFAFDGIDGVGKSTQIKLFCEAIKACGRSIVICRDPGSTPLGESIREILLHADETMPIGRRSEMLLYMAARAQLVDEVIRPALDAGRTVVSDRFLLANIVYQAHAGGLDEELVRQVGQIATEGVMPDCTFLLDMSPADADARLRRSLDRMESQGAEYRRRLREGFLREAARPNSRIHVIDASQTIEAVQADVWQIAATYLTAGASPDP